MLLKDRIELSIIMPCLNEEASLPSCLFKANSFLSENSIVGEVIVADNGSIDNSLLIATQYKAKIVIEKETGYGNAIMAGLRASRGEYIIIGDSDDSYDFSNLMPLLNLLRQGYDLVIGNRFKGGIKKGAMPFLHRYFGNQALSFIGRLFFQIKIGDFQCGLRGLARRSIDQLDLRTSGMEFSSEIIVKAALNKMQITEIPIILYPDKRKRPSHLRTWRDGWRHLRFLLLYSPRWLFLIPGLTLVFFGFTFSVILLLGPIHLGNKKLDVHTLVYTSIFILIGFQFISFYFFTKLYSATHGLLPGRQKFIESFNRYFKLEKGILIGAFLILGGIFLAIKSFFYWGENHFGNLNPAQVLRWVIPSALLIAIGMQLILSFFYLSFLTIESRREKNPK